jgi:hypothetical protein
MDNSNQQAILYLDNAEDLMESTNQELKPFLDKILIRVPGLTILITSRPSKGLFEDGNSAIKETYFKVEPLNDCDSVQLFIKHVREKI